MLRILSDAEAVRYFNAWPDLNPAYALNPMGLTRTQWATAHYNKFGIAEKRGLDGPAKTTDLPVGQPVNTNILPGTNMVIIPKTTEQLLGGSNNLIIWGGIALLAVLMLKKM